MEREKEKELGSSDDTKCDGVPASPPDYLTASGFGEASSTSALVRLWEDAIAQYRKTGQLTASEEEWLLQDPAAAESHLQTLIVEWSTFRGVKNRTKFEIKILETLKVLHMNIETLDAMIGLPSQIVSRMLCFQ
jgi:hypothetical protein